MGHAFQQTIMDIMIRYQRMQGTFTTFSYIVLALSVAAHLRTRRQRHTERRLIGCPLGRYARRGESRHRFGAPFAPCGAPA